MDATLFATGIGSGLSHSLYAAGSKFVLTRRGAHPFVFLVYVNALQAAITPLIWLFVEPVFPVPAGWVPIAAAAGTCTAAYFFLYLALSCGDVSSVMPMMGSKVIFATLLARLMLGEQHIGSTYLAALLVAIAVAALGYSPSEAQPSGAAVRPAALMMACCLVFACTDIYIKRSLAYVDPFSFMVYYNGLVALGSLLAIPYLKTKAISVRLGRADVLIILLTAGFLVTATMLLVVSFRLAQGVVIPNILMSSRGVFIVLFSAVASYRKSTALDLQSKSVYVLRLAASVLIIFSIWLAMR